MGSCTNSDLCIKCGACCDGTAWGYVHLDENDLKGVTIEMNLLKAGGNKVLKQPCPAHVNNACTIYADRPAICRSYECMLLKDYKKGEVTEQEAFQAIEQLQTLKREIDVALKAAGIDNDKDDVHLRMWTLEKEALVTLSTQQFHDLHRPLLEKYQVFKEVLINQFGIESKVVSSFPMVAQSEN